MREVIVIGSPRSGTSVIARILQQRCGVMMDEGPIKKDERNPHGYYEDHRLVRINATVLKRWQHGTHNEDRVDLVWSINFAVWAARRNRKYSAWGFKDPRMMGFIQWAYQFLSNPIFVWPIRTPAQIIRSQSEKMGINKEIATQGIKAYSKLIEKHIPKNRLLRLDLSRRRSEKELAGILSGAIWQ